MSVINRPAVKRDLRLILGAGREHGIPVLIGSAGGAGARPHLDWCVDIIQEIAAEDGLDGALAIIPTDVDRDRLLRANSLGDIREMSAGPTLDEAAVRASNHIVAQIGEAPLIAALIRGADVVVAGRCYDPAVFAAVPIMRGYLVGLSLHMGKVLKCAAIAALPGSGSDCMFATLDETGFTVETLSEERACTVAYVAAHKLHDKSDPCHLPGPAGSLDLSKTEFEQTDPRRVPVRGTVFSPEGARPTGFRTVSVAGVRAPDFIAAMDDITVGVRTVVATQFPEIERGSASLFFCAYSREGVMGGLEPNRDHPALEVGLVIEAVAES